MLRFEHMPSDFNPLFLFLGDGPDLAALARLLRSFAEAPRPLDLRAELPHARSGAALRLLPVGAEGGGYGLRPDGEGSYRWGLNAWQAERIAERIELLTPPGSKSGSDTIELGVEGEIPVKVSRGEFTDDFLVQRF